MPETTAPSLANVRLQTARLQLRPMTGSDAAALFAMFSDAAVTRYLSHPPWPAIDRARDRIAEDAQAMAAGKYLRLGIEEPAAAELVGECVLFNLAHESRRAEIGYVLARRAWGRGYMGEALPALLDFAFEQLNLNRVEAEIDPRNTASARILSRLGFRQEGLLRERWIVAGEVSDSALYGLLRADWQHGPRT